MTAVKKIEAHETQVSVPVSQNEALVRMIQEAATNPEIDLDRMERLFEMRERIMGQEAKTAFFSSLADAQAEIKPVVKNQRNNHTKSDFADLFAISDAIQPIITKHGFGLTFSEGVSEKPDHLRVICEVVHRGGHSKTYWGEVPIDAAGAQGRANKTKVQAYGSTKTYGRRYLKLDIFDVALRDNDGNQVISSDPITQDQFEILQGLIDETNTDIQTFCNHFKIAAVADMPASGFKRAELLLKQKQGKANG